MLLMLPVHLLRFAEISGNPSGDLDGDSRGDSSGDLNWRSKMTDGRGIQ